VPEKQRCREAKKQRSKDQRRMEYGNRSMETGDRRKETGFFSISNNKYPISKFIR
jgi:hypothetical protein